MVSTLAYLMVYGGVGEAAGTQVNHRTVEHFPQVIRGLWGREEESLTGEVRTFSQGR